MGCKNRRGGSVAFTKPLRTLSCSQFVDHLDHRKKKPGHVKPVLRFPLRHRALALGATALTALTPRFAHCNARSTAPKDMFACLSTFTASAPRQASLPWSDVNLLIVTDVHSWVAGHPHTDHM